MHVNTRLSRGDRIRMRPDPDWPNEPEQPIWELLCNARPADDDPRLDPDLRGAGLWSVHIRHVTAGTYDHSAVGDINFMMVRMDQVDYIARAAEPDRSCDGEECA